MGTFYILGGKRKYMDPVEYLAIIPLLIYGIGLSDLLSQWKRFFNKDDRYPIYIIYTFILTEVAIYNVVIYIDVLNAFAHQTYFQYLGSLVPPILFMIVVHVFTPDEGSRTREYVKENASLIFTLMALFVASHYFYPFEGYGWEFYLRIFYVLSLVAVAYFRKEWMMYTLAVAWFAGLLLRGSMMAA